MTFAEFIKQNKEKIAQGMTLREIRELHGMTQAQLSQRIGINQGLISRIENKNDLMISTLRKYARGFNCGIQVRFTVADETIEISLES